MKQNLPKYEKYKNSGIDWIGEIPEGWEVKKLKFFGNIFAGLADKKGSDFEKEYKNNLSKFIPFTSIANGTKVQQNYQYVLVKDWENQNLVVKGDILFLMSSETLEDIAKCSIYEGRENLIYLNSFCKGFRIQNDALYPYYANYLLGSDVYRNYFAQVARGFTRINLKQKYIKNAFICIPTPEEQKAIANFLDEKTEKIDRAVRIKEQQIALLKERKQILIQNAVTKGLNPNAPMKDSGIEWIGEIPAHWEITITKYILKKLERPRKQNGNTVICSNHGYSKLIGDINQGLVSLTQHDYQGVNEGDLLVHGMDAWHGAISISKHTGDCTSVVHVCDSKYNKTYIAYFLKILAFMNVYKAISNGVRQNTSDFRSWQKFGNIQILLPSKEEQKQIAEYLKTQIKKTDHSINLQTEQVKKLKEYKAILIQDAVTGKIKVV